MWCEQVCSVTFARIQGKVSMVSRFQNSSLLEKVRCLNRCSLPCCLLWPVSSLMCYTCVRMTSTARCCSTRRARTAASPSPSPRPLRGTPTTNTTPAVLVLVPR